MKDIINIRKSISEVTLLIRLCNIGRFAMIVCLLNTVIIRSSLAQKIDYPEIGQRIPSFNFDKVDNYSSGTLSQSGLLGKYVILDFWSVTCKACIDGFPKMNEMQIKFKDDMEIVLVGLEEEGRNVKKVFNIFKKRYNLKLISVYDSIYFHKLIEGIVPNLIWVNKEGIIKAITNGTAVNEENINKFINDQEFDFQDASYLGRRKSANEVDMTKPLLIKGNGGADSNYLFRSVLADWKPGMGKGSYLNIDHYLKYYKKPRYQTTKASLAILYKIAYFGTINYLVGGFAPDPIIIKDSLISRSSLYNHYYNYSMDARGDKPENLMMFMQENLKQYFPYKISVVNTDIPIRELIIIDSAKFSKISTANSETNIYWNIESKVNSFTNVDLNTIALHLTKYLPFKICYSATDKSNNIDLEFKGNINDLSNIKRQLRKAGLDLVDTTRKMKALEITRSN